MFAKRYTYILMVLLMQTIVLEAQVRKNVQHRLRFTTSAGYSWDVEQKKMQEESIMLNSFGVKPMVGFGYRMEYGHLIVDAGMDVGYRYVNDKLVSLSDNQEQNLGGSLVWNVATEQNDRHLHCQHVSVGVPVAVGFKMGYVYGTLGAKVGVAMPNTDKIGYLYTETRSNVIVLTPIVYHRDEKRQYSVSDEISVDLMVTAELGARLDKIDDYHGYYKDRSPFHHYLAVFAEVSAYNSAPAIEMMWRIPVTVGIKYTLEIEKKNTFRCVVCEGE